jgi:hypothetical protein
MARFLTIISEFHLSVKGKCGKMDLPLHRQWLREPRAGVPVDVPLLIRQRLSELGLDQKDLAAATQVTESYISQLLARKKAPPAPGRTDITRRSPMPGTASGELRLADVQRKRS